MLLLHLDLKHWRNVYEPSAPICFRFRNFCFENIKAYIDSDCCLKFSRVVEIPILNSHMEVLELVLYQCLIERVLDRLVPCFALCSSPVIFTKVTSIHYYFPCEKQMVIQEFLKCSYTVSVHTALSSTIGHFCISCSSDSVAWSDCWKLMAKLVHSTFFP